MPPKQKTLNSYLDRLCFLDKIGYDRALSEFHFNEKTMGESENSFILSLLDSGNNFSTSSVRSAFSFIESWANFGYLPNQTVLSRLLFCSFKEPRLFPQIVFLNDILPNNGWIFHSLKKIMTNDFELFTQTIKKNYLIWNSLLDIMEEDINSKPISYKTAYYNRPNSYLCEVFVLFFDCPKTSSVEISDLVSSLSKFLIDIKSDISFRLLSLIGQVFPNETFFALNQANLEFLSSKTLEVFYNLKLLEKYTPPPSGASIYAAKIMHCNFSLAMDTILSLNETSPEKAVALEIANHFDQENSQFIIEPVLPN